MELSEMILCRHPVQGGVAQFWQAVLRLHKNPHFVNRRISATVNLFAAEIQHPENGRELLELVMKSDLSSDMEVNQIKGALELAGMHIENEGPYDEREHHLQMEMKKLFPRYNKVFKEMLQITIIDSIQNEYVVIGLPYGKGVISSPLSPAQPFGLRFVDDEMLLITFQPKISNDKSIAWLKDCLFSKLQRWTEENEVQSTTGIQSLSLIPADQYTVLYQKLKEKYGKKLVEIWPERTDPQKFVFEDVAIATYLLLLWEAQRFQENRPDWRQTFVDMGCGNGLLVYILSSEGYPGIGVDVRKRGIWDLYPTSTQLKVQSFVPSNSNIFPEADWIIGNHSDELTPWIPVIAARSSYTCSFFLLPCCAYVFNGRKYQRLDSSRSQYSEYLNYIESICKKCGFITNLDRLKIPSTKRICLVGSGRSYSENNFEEKQEEIKKYVQNCSKIVDGDEKCSEVQTQFPLEDGASSSMWTSHFIAREPKEEVRNCTQLKKDIINNIVQIVVKQLLEERNSIPVKNSNGEERLWNAGCSKKLNEIAASMPPNLLTELKKEFGGLQTLLKNNHEIFYVASGSVRLAIPVTINEKKAARVKDTRRKGELKLKQKPCWFFNYHPDGCLLKSDECTFYH